MGTRARTPTTPTTANASRGPGEQKRTLGDPVRGCARPPPIRAQHHPGAPQTPGPSAGQLAEALTWWEHPRTIHSRPGGRLWPRPEVCPKERDAAGPAEQARRPGAQVARAEGAWQAQRSSGNSSRAGGGRREGRRTGRLEALFPRGGGLGGMASSVHPTALAGQLGRGALVSKGEYVPEGPVSSSEAPARPLHPGVLTAYASLVTSSCAFLCFFISCFIFLFIFW